MTVKQKRRIRWSSIGKMVSGVAMVFFIVVLTSQIISQFQVMIEAQEEIERTEKIQEIYEKAVGDLTVQKEKLNDANYLEIVYRCDNSMVKEGELIFDLSGLDYWND